MMGHSTCSHKACAGHTRSPCQNQGTLLTPLGMQPHSLFESCGLTRKGQNLWAFTAHSDTGALHLFPTGPVFSKAQCGQTVSPPGGICLGMANWHHLPLDGASSLFLPNTPVPGISALQPQLLLEGRGPLAGTWSREPEQSPGNNFPLHFQAGCFAEGLSDFVVTPS